MQRITDPDVIRALATAPGLGLAGELIAEKPVTYKFKYVKDTTTTYAVFTPDDDGEPIVFRLAVARVVRSREEDRSEARKMLDEFIANGRTITTVADRKGAGHTAKDWARLQQGLKVATKEEIAIERERRALIAVGNNDADNVIRLLTGKFDKEIKFDIENDRLGPNGEIR